MKSLTQEILSFLQSNGFDCSIRTCNGLEFICTYSLTTKQNHTILPLSIEAGSVEEASCLHENTKEAIRNITSQYSEYPLIVTEDRWHLQPEAMQKRILAHLEIFNPIFARNCEVRRIDKALAKVFLEANHSYGHAACRYCYGMFLKRHTGHIAQQTTSYAPGTLVAVATFSNARKWSKGDIMAIRYGDMKKQLAADINAFCAPIRERIIDFKNTDEYLSKVAREGAEAAAASAEKTIREVREIIGFKN